MQPNGSFFGSMLPRGASSFMPPGAASSPGSASPAGAQSFTSPPMDPQLLAALAALSKQQDQGQQMGQQQFQPPTPVTPGSQQPGMGQPQMTPGGGAQNGMQGGLQAVLQQLKGMDPNVLKAIFARLGQQGQQAQQGQQPPAMPPRMPGA